jgi:hypothetical protein
MTHTIGVYTSGTTSTTTSLPEPDLELQATFAWMAVSTSEAADQAWFWTPEWQEGEREVDEHLAAGRTQRFGSVDEFLAALERETG